MLKKPLKYREVFIFKINLYSVYCLVNNIPQTIDFFTLHLYKFNCKVQVVCPFQICLRSIDSALETITYSIDLH